MNASSTIMLCCAVLAGVVTASSQETLSSGGPSYASPVVLSESVNSSADEYGPAVDRTTNRLLFTSERTGTAQQWWTTWSGTTAERCAGTFNEDGSHRAYVTVSDAGEAIGVAFVPGERQWVPTLVSVQVEGNLLHMGRPLAAVQTADLDVFTSQPTLSPDGRRMVFVSDRPGGVGGLDLWMCDRVSPTEWSAPFHLPGTINAAGDEVSPRFVSADSLVYASNSYGGKGGFDVFVAVLRNEAWQEPQPLDVLNTEFNDTDAVQLPDGSWIVASDRPGGAGGYDLWLIRRQP